MKKIVFRGKIEWKNKTYEINVIDDNNFSKLKNITQVYGFVFNGEGKILIVKLKGKEWGLPGGGPEKIDKNWQETLKREVDEETNIDIIEISPAGYVLNKTEMHNEKNRTGCLLRAVAKVKKIKERVPDPATGSINERKFISPNEFLDYCKWGDNGKAQLDLALKAYRDLQKV